MLRSSRAASSAVETWSASSRPRIRAFSPFDQRTPAALTSVAAGRGQSTVSHIFTEGAGLFPLPMLVTSLSILLAGGLLSFASGREVRHIRGKSENPHPTTAATA